MKLIKSRFRHTLLILGSFRGNARGCLLTEPMWGITYNLYIAYASLYMRALGCSPQQIGAIASIGLVFEMIFSFTGGYITDRLGRKKTTLIFDVVAWTIPTLIWAGARGYAYFITAAIINSIVRIVYTSWSCLLIEDTPRRRRVHVFTWIRVAGTLSGFFAPLAGMLVSRAGLVPAVRGLYLLACAAMTAMFFIRNHLTHETTIGYQKMAEAKGRKFRDTFIEYRDIIRLIRTTPSTLFAFLIVLLANVQLLYNRTFLSILLREQLEFQLVLISVVPALSSVVKMIVFVFVMPGLGRIKPSKAIFYGLCLSGAGLAMLLSAPVRGIGFAFAGVLLNAVGFAITGPFAETLLANSIADEHRAKIVSLFHTVMNGLMSPFGYLGGVLAAGSPRFPFALLFATVLIQFLLTRGVRRFEEPAPQARR
jgi:MFS transporter, DHA1 family, tetracycline resistance protein